MSLRQTLSQGRIQIKCPKHKGGQLRIQIYFPNLSVHWDKHLRQVVVRAHTAATASIWPSNVDQHLSWASGFALLGFGLGLGWDGAWTEAELKRQADNRAREEARRAS